MKKALLWYIDCVLSDYKFYRKKVGGKWYHVKENESGSSGFSGNSDYWSRQLPPDGDYTILKDEEY